MITYQALAARLAPYAAKVATATGLLTGAILALMLEESGYGTSAAAAAHNWSGIMYYPGLPGATGQIAGGYAAFASDDAWADAMISVLRQQNMSVILQSAGQDASHQFTAFAESPYDGAPWSDRVKWADLLMEVYTEQGLAQYDGGGAPAPAPSPSAWSPTITGSLGGVVSVDTAGAPAGAIAVLAIIGAIIAWAAL